MKGDKDAILEATGGRVRQSSLKHLIQLMIRFYDGIIESHSVIESRWQLTKKGVTYGLRV